MNKALAVGLLLVPFAGSAFAEPSAPRRDVIWGKAKPHVHATPIDAVKPAGTITTISHVIYMNNCLPSGCALHAGDDDAQGRVSSIADGDVTLSAWSFGADNWASLVACVQATYAPFDITVTDVDPGTAPHSEIIVAGTAAELNSQLTNAGGVAPFLGCGALYDDTISFMFAEDDGDDLNYLCGGAAQETSHVFGLDHELLAADPMTYLDLGSHKSFQNAAAQCGETAGMPRQCYSLFDPSSSCAGPTQNSYQYLMDHFGPAMLTPATLAITKPVDGAFVRPSFTVTTTATDQLSLTGGSLAVDGQPVGVPVTGADVMFVAPSTIASGSHMLTVTATDGEARTLTASVTVNVLATCSPTSKCTGADTGCIDGYCTPLADTAGGLGATCDTNDACISGSCATDGTSKLCTGTCDATNICPSGFDCEASSGTSGVCWPEPPGSGGGGCSTDGGGGASAVPVLMLSVLGLLVVTRRRRA